MRVEVDVSDLTELAYFIDKRCGDLEKILRKNPAFVECVVKRQHFDEDWELDPFVIQDMESNNLVSIDPLEVDTLSESELQSFIDVQINREQYDYAGSALLFIIILILFGPFAGLFSILIISGWLNPYSVAVALVFGIIVLFAIMRFYSKRKNAISNRNQIDLVAARESSSFLDALHKLASLSGIHDWKREEYVKRVQNIEESLSGFNS